MKKALYIAIILIAGMLIIPFHCSAADPANPTVWGNSDNIKNVKPTFTRSSTQTQKPAKENEKQSQSIAFQSATIYRLSTGEWRWDVKIKATQNRQVPADTAKVRVWQNAGGKKILLATRTYNRPINPGYGILVDKFFPSGESDTLDFELIELKEQSGGVTTNQDANNVVDRASAAVPPFGITMPKFGYSYNPEPAYLYCYLNNNSQWPMRVKVVMRAGRTQYSEYLHKIRHQEVVLLEKGSQTKIRKDWTYTDKGYGYFRISTEAQLLDPATGKVVWTEIIEHQGNLPTN